MARARPEERAGMDGPALTRGPEPSRWPFRITRSLWVFWLMFAINLLNYLDRLIVVAVGPTLKAEFHLTDRSIGILSSSFLLIYTLAALPLGLLADRTRSRARLVAVVVGVWSVVSGLTALARGFGSLVITRALVGVGEAGYYPAGTALLSSYYPRDARARIMGRWQAGQLVGILAAFLLAGALFAALPAQVAWRVAFLISAAPGLALAGLMWLVVDAPPERWMPPSGEAPGAATVSAPRARPPAVAAQIGAALRIPSIWVVAALQAIVLIISTPAITFLPIYVRSREGPFHLGAAHASFLTGTVIVTGGLLGSLLGGPLADLLRRWHPGGRVLAVAVGFALALPFFITMLRTTNLMAFSLAAGLTVLALSLSAGPLTAIPPDVAPRAVRATAVAVTMLLSHILGDVWAPAAVGALATRLREQVGPAMLIIGIPALVAGIVVAIVGANIYVRNLRDARED